MCLQRLFHHLVFVVGVFIMVAVSSVSSYETVVELGLRVEVVVDPLAEFVEAGLVEVYVGDKGNLESVYLL